MEHRYARETRIVDLLNSNPFVPYRVDIENPFYPIKFNTNSNLRVVKIQEYTVSFIFSSPIFTLLKLHPFYISV